MIDIFNTEPLEGLAAAIAAAAGVEAPKQSHPPLRPVLDLLENTIGVGNAERVLMFNPDAIGTWLTQRYTEDFAPVFARTRLALPLRVVMPSCTPVCFATMYTGVTPDVHGIRRYEKPVVKTDSLFDTFHRAGKRVAIVSVPEASMSKIFLEREIDYYIEPSDLAATEKAIELISADKYDFIACYNADYDSKMHQYGTESPEALAEMRSEIDSFARLYDTAKKAWAGKNAFIAWATDHGMHDLPDGRGTHGEYIPEDMNVTHFYTVLEK